MRLAALLVALAAPVMAQDYYEEVPTPLSLEALLIPDAMQYLRMCRQPEGSGQGELACGARDQALYTLTLVGWCFGRRGENYGDWLWHTCAADSNRVGKPDFSGR